VNNVERELLGSSNPRPKKRSAARVSEFGDLCDGMFGDAEDGDDATAEDNTPMGKLDMLRKMGARAKRALMQQYLVKGMFCLLHWLSDQETSNKVIYVLGRRVLPHFSASAISENTFSTHSAFAGKLRIGMGSAYLAMFVKANRNHALFYALIKDKIKPLYLAKFGRGGIAFNDSDSSSEGSD
jgi:hypothetical protein